MTGEHGMRWGVWFAVGMAVFSVAAGTDAATNAPTYVVEDHAFVRRNGERFNNRPLYANQIAAIVVAGDRPLLRIGVGSLNAGTFLLAVARGETARWLHEASDITAEYRPGRMTWIVRDASFDNVTVTLEAVPPADGAGLAVRATVKGGRAGDRLIWACGGAVPLPGKTVLDYWDVTTHGREKTMLRGFDSRDCLSNRVSIADGMFSLSPASGGRTGTVIGRCSAPTTLTAAEATAFGDPLALSKSDPGAHPMACGTVSLDGVSRVHWAIHTIEGTRPAIAARIDDPTAFFAAGLERAERIGRRVTVQSPDPWLDAAVGAAGAVMDGIYRQGVYTHSGMRWGVPLLGWRSIYGATAYGWHDRVKAQARTCLARQIKESTKNKPTADARCGLACQSTDSSLFGRGRVDAYHPWHYDMQTQFFDQLIHAWRWTGDAELEGLLRPALDLHLDYLRTCFDPDDDGLYESYANTWPTDNSWFSGGGCAEETAYVFAAHRAAAELARRASDARAAAAHAARAERIHAAFQRTLWLEERGHPGQSVEQGGHRRVRPDAWLYAIFCPIDAGLLSAEQTARSLYYTEWGLQRERMPYGGQRCWPSNWVPSIWSLRQMWPGDNYALALAYWQAGLPDDAWELLRGTFPDMLLFGHVPGDLGYTVGSTDFSDCASVFCRAVVEGLFGFRPDYPNGVVTLAPQLPAEWEHASIATPDFSLAVRGHRYDITLARSAALELRLPVRARAVTGVTVNGAPARWTLEAGFGCSVVTLRVPAGTNASVAVAIDGPLPPVSPTELAVDQGETLRLPVDPAELCARSPLPSVPGHHLVEALVRTGATRQRRLFKVAVRDPVGEAARDAKLATVPPADARWEMVDLAPILNADVRAIFQQAYLAPRPATCSLRIAQDGYSSWQMMLKPTHRPPTIDLDGVKALLDSGQRLRTPDGVSFAWPGDGRNIAFTSQWTNWPDVVTVPVDRAGRAVWFLVCGFTPPMQCRIANAELRMRYADGVVETLELVPPLNFWSLCPFGGVDYDYGRDGYALPAQPPPQVQLGSNCRAMVYGWNLRPGVRLENVTLETLSPEVIIGLMGVSVMEAP